MRLKALRYEADMTRRMIKPRLVEIGNINISRFNRIADIYKEKGMAPLSEDLHGLYYGDYLQKDIDFNLVAKVTVAISIALLVIVLSMAILNRRLNAAVIVRTQELDIANKKVEKTNHRLKEMVGFVSHDLRNPLSNIISMARMLKSGRITESRMPLAIDTINDSAEKSLELVQAILEAAALGTGKYQLNKQPIELSGFLGGCITNHKRLADTRDVSVELKCNSVEILADKHRISQVLDNILLNAVKYSLSTSKILVSTAIDKNRVIIRCTNKVGANEILTGDESILFKSFGFGLEIVREILELHGSSLFLTTQGDEYIAEFSLDLV
ncbi:MAG: HAMP domain-containing histidine kinase [Pseudomonadales bacterium]|nr:HAMP domain-containing histidine kinase [Pseudomonadales bacterium]